MESLPPEDIQLHKSLKGYTFGEPQHEPELGRYTVKAYYGNNRVGELSYADKPHTLDSKHPHVGYHLIKGADVHPSHRGNGVYGRLLQIAALHAKKTLKSKGLVSPGKWRSEAADGAWERLASKGKARGVAGYGDPETKDFFMSEGPRVLGSGELRRLGYYNSPHGVFLSVPINQIHGLDPEPKDWVDDKGAVQSFQAGNAIKTPIELHVHPSGGFTLYDGNHRLKQARTNGQTHISALVHDKSNNYVALSQQYQPAHLLKSEMAKHDGTALEQMGYQFKVSHLKDRTGNIHNTTVSVTHPDAYKLHGDDKVGAVDFGHHGDSLVADQVWVHDDHRNQGIARHMYRLAAQATGKDIKPSETQTQAGSNFWLHKGEETSPDNIQHEWDIEFKRWLKSRREGRSYVQFHMDVHKAEQGLNSLLGRGNLKDAPSPSHHDVAMAMNGYDPESSPEFVAARFLAGGSFASEEAVRTAIILYDDDFELAALRTYGLPRNEHYRELLRNAMGLMGHLSNDVKKSEIDPVAIPRDIRAALPEGEKLAEVVRKAQVAGKIHAIQLDPSAKHSKGTALVTDVDTDEKWLLKPGSGKLSPSAGVADETADQSNREVAFTKIADAVGMGQYYPEAELLMIDGQPVACLKLLDTDYKGMEKLRQADSDFKAAEFFKPYLENGILYRWALIDGVLGNSDRHANNLMVNEDGNDVKLIDHGSAFAGIHFDPAHDTKSFIPFYLRAWSEGQRWSKMYPQQKEDAVPRLNEQQAKEFGEWVDTIDENQLKEIMVKYGLNPKPVLDRLQRIKSADVSRRADVLIGMWVGVYDWSALT